MIELLYQIITVYTYIVILDIILSWLVPVFSQFGFLFTIKRFLDRLVEPALEPIRRLLRPYTRNMPLDFSPLILILALQLLQSLLIRFAGGPQIIVR